MCIKSEQEKLTGLISEALSNICKSAINFKSSLNIEGLMGITIDDSSVCMVSIRESVAGNHEADIPHVDVTVTHTISDVVDPSSEGIEKCSDNSSNSDDKGVSLDFTVSDIQSTLTTGKYSELDMLLNPTCGGKKTQPDLIDPSGTLFNAVELEQIMNESKDVKEADIDQLTEGSFLGMRKDSRLPNKFNQTQPATKVTVESAPQPEILLNFGKSDDVPGCSAWDDPFADAIPLNLSETVEPQDLSTSPHKVGLFARHFYSQLMC